MSATSSSYGANPLACAAGQAVLDIIEEPGFLDRVGRVAAVLAAGIRDLEAASPYVRQSRGVGMMLGFDLVDPATQRPAGSDLCRQLFQNSLDAGILTVGDVPSVRLNPPIVLTEGEANEAMAALQIALTV